jgi:hypothetical protein
MFERIGAFHLGTGHEEPIAALELELERTGGTNALIVLPEGFNLGKHYSSEPGIPKFERDVVLRQLSAIARRLATAFVVGLLEPEPEGSRRPHSSAYFISATKVSLMCHKQRWDGSGHYSVCPEAADRANPIIQADASVIAAICMDVQSSQRFAGVAIRAARAEKKRNFVCIPAAMGDTSWFGGATLGSSQNFLKYELNGSGNLILANSDHRGVGSFITGPDWRVLACTEHQKKAENRLLIAQMPDGPISQ